MKCEQFLSSSNSTLTLLCGHISTKAARNQNKGATLFIISAGQRNFLKPLKPVHYIDTRSYETCLWGLIMGFIRHPELEISSHEENYHDFLQACRIE